MWNFLLVVGQQVLKQIATRTLVPTSLNAIKSTISTTKAITSKKAIISKGISGISNLAPAPLRSALNYTLKSKYNGISTLSSEHITNLIKADIKKSLYNQLVPQEIKSIIAIFNKAENYLNKKLREEQRRQNKLLKERIKELARERRETLRRIREIKNEIRRFQIDERKIIRFINKKEKELWLKVERQLKEQIRIQKRINKQIHEDIQRRYKEQEKNVRLFNKHLANIAYEENNNLHFNDFFDFTDTLNDKERKNLEELLHKHTTVRISFNSKWIKAAMWEPIINIREYKDQVGQMTNNYKGGKNKVFSNSARGILKIIIKKKFKSSNNPKRLYVWYNVSFGTWKKIVAIRNGKNFWNVFYRRNRTNRKYITNESKYYKYDRSVKYKYNGRSKRNPLNENYGEY